MDYKKIKSEPGGKGSQWKDEQPLTESRSGTAIPCPKRVQGGPKPPQMNMNGVSKYKP